MSVGLPRWLSGKKKIRLTMQEMQIQSLGWEDPLEKEMATHFNTLAWKFHGQREESDGLQSMGVSKNQTWQSN